MTNSSPVLYFDYIESVGYWCHGATQPRDLQFCVTHGHYDLIFIILFTFTNKRNRRTGFLFENAKRSFFEKDPREIIQLNIPSMHSNK